MVAIIATLTTDYHLMESRVCKHQKLLDIFLCLLNILDLSLHTTSFRTICAVDRKTKCMKVGDAHILDSSKRIFALSGLTNAQFYILTRTWLINQFIVHFSTHLLQ